MKPGLKTLNQKVTFIQNLTFLGFSYLPRPKNVLTDSPKTKKFFFQKCSLIFLKHVSNDCICCANSKNIHNMRFSALKACAHSLTCVYLGSICSYPHYVFSLIDSQGSGVITFEVRILIMQVTTS